MGRGQAPKFKWSRLAKYQPPEGYMADPMARYIHKLRALVQQRRHLVRKGEDARDQLPRNSTEISSMRMPEGEEYQMTAAKKVQLEGPPPSRDH